MRANEEDCMPTLEVSGGTKIEEPTPDDIARALEGARDADWYLNLARGDDDYMDAMIEDGALWVECEENGVFVQAQSYVDDAMLKAMLLDFRDGGSAWRDQALWVEPSGKPKKPKAIPIPLIAGGIFGVLLLTAVFIGNGPWLVAVFALALPGMIATAALTKQREAKRAAAWTKASARIVRSEMVKEKKNDKEVDVPKVEYEFPVGFHKFRGHRVSLGEIIGPIEATEMMKRYRVGGTAPVYYNRDDPRESVLERDLPEHFQMVWVAVAVLVFLILGVAYWVVFR